MARRSLSRCGVLPKFWRFSPVKGQKRSPPRFPEGWCAGSAARTPDLLEDPRGASGGVAPSGQDEDILS